MVPTSDVPEPRLFSEALGQIAHPFVVIEPNGVICEAGAKVAELTGWAAPDLVGRHFLDLIVPAERDAAVAAFGTSFEMARGEDWQPLTVSVGLVRPDGSHSRCLVTLVLPPSGEVVVLQLRPGSAEALIDTAMDEMGTAVDVDGVLATLAEAATDASSAAVICYGWDGEAFVGMVASTNLAPGLVGAEGPRQDWHALLAERRIYPIGELAAAASSVAAWADEAGYADLVVLPVGASARYAPAALLVWRRFAGPALFGTSRWDRIAAVATVAIESHRRRALLERAATIDQLTELENRRGLVGRLGQLSRGELIAERVTALYCDLDGFKAVNDAYGHLVGDRVLAVAAQRLRNAVRPTDMVARLGGDEFAVILLDAPAAMVPALADRLIAAVSRPVEIDGQVHRVGLSVGIATIDAPGDPDALLDRADRALLEAKATGKGGWVEG